MLETISKSIKNKDILDTFEDFKYVYYIRNEKLIKNYHKMFAELKLAGHMIRKENTPIDRGILLENNNEVIAGCFFNVSKISSVILIDTIFVDQPYRQKGIYKKMHFLLDTIGKNLNKKSIYSSIHIDNQIMQQHVMKKIGYEVVLHTVKRDIL